MLIILDRDGVINIDTKEYIKTPAEWQPIPNSLEAIAKLKKAGHIVVIATNQSGLARGLFSLETLDKIHAKMQSELQKHGGSIDAIYFCPHHPDEKCDCRKPQPGLLLQIKNDYQNEFNDAIFVGDSLRDLEAAQAAHCKFAFVKTGNGYKTIASQSNWGDINIYEDLAEFADSITACCNHKKQ